MSAPHADHPLAAMRDSPVSWALMTLAHAQRARAASRLAPLGLFPGQELMLMQLWHEDGRSQKELGGLLGLDHSTVAKSVQRLERSGLVKRSRSPLDGRVVLVHVTEEGLALEAPVLAVWSELEALATTPFSPSEREQFLALTAKLMGQEDRASVSNR